MSASSVDEVLELFGRWGCDPYDEEVAQLEHALQTAALAVRSGAGDALVAAALLHDVGHLLDLRDGREPSAGDRGHEDTGAAWLRPLFPTAVTAAIALHVRAKRYLCAVDPVYAACLSTGSMRSLAQQGGPMSAAEAQVFRGAAGHDDAVQLRRWDDAGKVDGLAVAALGDHVELLHRVAIPDSGQAGAWA